MRSLVRKADFKNLVEQGKRLKASPWLIVNYDKNSFGYLRLGCTLSRKVGTAVIRNKLRRWSKEWFRKQEEQAIDINLLFLESRQQDFYKRLTHKELDLILENAFTKIQNSFK